MRFYVSGPARAKSLAKSLSKTASQSGIAASLSQCQAALADALGYSSFGELLKVSQTPTTPSLLDDEVPEQERSARLAYQTAAFVRKLGLKPMQASELAAAVKLTGRPGKGLLSAPKHAGFQTTHHWPVRYEGALRQLPADALETLDTIIEILAPGESTVGTSDLVEHAVFAEARQGNDPHILVRYAKPSEALSMFGSGNDDEEFDEDDDDFPDDRQEEDRREIETWCHPSVREEA